MSRGARAADDRAAVRLDASTSAARLQLAQRLAHRRPADAELAPRASPAAGARRDGISPLSTRDWIAARGDRRGRRADRGRRSCVTSDRRARAGRQRPPGSSAKTMRSTCPGSASASERAEDAADGAERAEAKREPEVADALAVQARCVATIAVGRTTRSDVASAACWERPGDEGQERHHHDARRRRRAVPPHRRSGTRTPTSATYRTGAAHRTTQEDRRQRRGRGRRRASTAVPRSGRGGPRRAARRRSSRRRGRSRSRRAPCLRRRR